MPRNKANHKKFQNLEDEDGWTHVIRGPRLPSSEVSRSAKDEPVSKLSQLKAASVLSLDQIRSQHSKSQQYWAEDPLRHRFEKIFKSRIINSLDTIIDNVLVLGLGSLARDNVDSNSMHQLVLFEHWIEFLRWYCSLQAGITERYLGTRYTISKIYFQDPQFHDTDRVFLTGQGYSVIDDPEAYLLLTKSTLLFAPYLPWQVSHTFLYVSYPALLIGNIICAYDDAINLQPERQVVLGQPVIKDFYVSRSWDSLDGRSTKEALIGPKHLQWLHNMVIYWQCGGDSQEIHKASQIELDQSNTILREWFEQQQPDLQRALGSMENISFRIGPGEWRVEGYVFDSNFRERIQEAQEQRTTDQRQL